MNTLLDGEMIVLVPSRSRPQNVEALARVANGTTARDDTKFVVVCDADDPTLPQYREVVRRWSNMFGLLVFERSPMKQGGALNNAVHALLHRRVEPVIIGSMNDDHRPYSPQWDHAVRTALSEPPHGRVAFAYGDDRIHGQRLPTAIFMTANVPRALGYICPPTMAHMYVDNVWADWADAVGARYFLSDVVIEHEHPIAGKAAWDDLYAEANHPDAYAADWDAYCNYHNNVGAYSMHADTHKMLDVNAAAERATRGETA